MKTKKKLKMNFIYIIFSIISIKLVVSTVINSSNSNKCHIYNSDNKNETNLLFDRIQVARNCHFQICFKLNNCENYITDTEYITKRKMPISTECFCNDNNNNLIKLKKNKNNSIITLNYLVKSKISTQAINSFEIYMDEIVAFNLTQSLIECTSGKFGKRIFQTNSFNLTEFNLSISINQYSIRLGINSNKLYEYKSIEKNDLIKSIHFIRLDNRYQLINNSEQVKPIILVNDSYAYHLNQLSIQKQHLFSILHDFSLNNNEIESIKYSLNTLNCLLNRTSINKKEKLALIKDDQILLIQLNHINTKINGLSKILKGSLNLKFNHNSVIIANETNIIMTQPQQVKTNNDLVIIVTAIVENDSNNETMKSFQNLIQIVLNEYKLKQCNSSNDLANFNNYNNNNNYEIKSKAFVLINGRNPATKNSLIEGKLLIEQIDDEHISISGYLNGLNNNSLHAMHIHETGLVEHNNCKDTGPHFNPLFSIYHGSPNESNLKNKHIGDLGNIKTDLFGSVYLNNLKFNHLTIKWKNIFNVLNRSIVIHQNTDDLGTADNLSSKSNGNSGPRIACGKIVII